jgi:type II secretory pathway component PulF
VKLPIPKGLERRMRPYVERGESFLREWEWTWTTAFVAGVVISFFAITTLAVIPSWWVYFADQTLKWRTRFLISIRDLIATGWISVWTGFFIITFYKLQVIRRRIRGERQAERYAGGYR